VLPGGICFTKGRCTKSVYVSHAVRYVRKRVSKAAHAFHDLHWVVFPAYEEDGGTDRLHCEPEWLVLPSHEAKEVAQRASTRNYVDFLSGKVGLDLENSLYNRCDWVLGESRSVRIAVVNAVVFSQALYVFERSPLWRLA
jgi:hypothetical protein